MTWRRRTLRWPIKTFVYPWRRWTTTSHDQLTFIGVWSQLVQKDSSIKGKSVASVNISDLNKTVFSPNCREHSEANFVFLFLYYNNGCRPRNLLYLATILIMELDAIIRNLRFLTLDQQHRYMNTQAKWPPVKFLFEWVSDIYNNEALDYVGWIHDISSKTKMRRFVDYGRKLKYDAPFRRNCCLNLCCDDPKTNSASELVPYLRK